MTRPPLAPKMMIMDACVLIDFINVERSVLELVVKHVGPLHVASPVVDEVNSIENENELLELGLIVFEPDIEDAYAAIDQKGPTSFQDRLCFFAAKRYGFTCVTNDKNLRKLCETEKIPLLWGLELIVELYRSGGIPAGDALKIGRRIRETNPKHITPNILNRFIDLIHKSF